MVYGGDITSELRELVDQYGLSVVHEALRMIGSYCENCGCPIVEGETHSPFGSMGSCYIQGRMHAPPDAD
jgi:hypothetical protein